MFVNVEKLKEKIDKLEKEVEKLKEEREDPTMLRKVGTIEDYMGDNLLGTFRSYGIFPKRDEIKLSKAIRMILDHLDLEIAKEEEIPEKILLKKKPVKKKSKPKTKKKK